MNGAPKDLYLNLLKKTLAFTLCPEPPIPIETFNYKNGRFKRLLVSLVSRILAWGHLQLVSERGFSPAQREEGMVCPGYAHTMVGLRRLDNLQFCVESAIREAIRGDLIETGVWRGGACILMRAILAAHGIEDRKVYVPDSFEGLPKPDIERFPADKDNANYLDRFLAVSQAEVEDNFRKYGLLDEQVVFLKGWFQDTLPNAPVNDLAVMRLDGDMYASTMSALTNLYPRLSEGGFCIIDDYALPECKKAVDDFRAANRITSDLVAVDWTGRYWRKE